jgi:putative component of membrane protein insertase Oxa1/YidC/SpoIIIJ protein YidD
LTNSQKNKNVPLLSFPRRRESSYFSGSWIPAFAGMTCLATVGISLIKYFSPLLIFCMLVSIAAAEQPELKNLEDRQAQSTMTAPIRFFQKYLSGADGHRCPMTPSCSSYALQAVERHGPVLGWIMASDRLMRCGRDELKHSPPVATRHGIRFRDGLDNNDFWLP